VQLLVLQQQLHNIQAAAAPIINPATRGNTSMVNLLFIMVDLQG
jgi:hypothetical protein